MAFVGERVAVGVAATVIASADADGITATVRNSDATAGVELGGSAVTALAGYTLPAGQSLTVDIAPGETLYGIVAAATVSVHVLRRRVG